MLESLTIKNFVLAESTHVAFGSGFHALTGETGAGKSILLDALGFVCGARSESRYLRKGASKASVTALFSDVEAHLAPVFKDLELDSLLEDGEGVSLRRVLDENGKSRAFLNDTPVTVAALRAVGDMLIDITSQHQSSGLLLQPQKHRFLLDSYAQHSEKLKPLAEQYTAWQAAEKELKRLADEFENAEAEQAYLSAQVQELDKVSPVSGEDAELAEQRALFKQQASVVGAITKAMSLLSEGEHAPHERVRQAERSLIKAKVDDAQFFDTALAALDVASEALASAETELNDVMSRFDTHIDIDGVEGRLFAIRALARKHNVQPDELEMMHSEMKQKLQHFEQSDTLIRDAEQRVQREKDAYYVLAQPISKARKKAANGLSKAVMSELPPLKMASCKVVIEVEQKPDNEWGYSGIDDVVFKVQTNPGSPVDRLDKVASGGELSRLLLAFKVVMRDAASVPTLLFDEIDSGMGGATADSMGKALLGLAAGKQVFAITHQPQVAGYAARHYKVEKETVGDATTSHLTLLNDAQRHEEMARMLAGSEITEEARLAASRLMESIA